MNQVRLVADSSCDLLTLSGMDFVSVPLTIRTETAEFRDDAALDVDGMVRALRDTNGRSYSACPNVADWEEAFGERGDVIAFAITSGLSGSYGVACAAKESCEEHDPSRRIQVFDSLSAGPEIALLIEKAAAELRAGADFDARMQCLEVVSTPDASAFRSGIHAQPGPERADQQADGSGGWHSWNPRCGTGQCRGYA